MKQKLPALLLTIFGLALSVAGQTGLKHFAEKGLSFDYPATIVLDDRSSPKIQHLVIQTKGQAQIMIVSHLAQVQTVEELASARREVVDPFVDTIWRQLRENDANVTRTVSKIDVAGISTPGVKMRAVLENQPGNAEIYSLQLGSRMVVLSLIGTDPEIAASAPIWLAIRSSLKVAAAEKTTALSLSH